MCWGMGQFLGTLKPSIIMNCNCICTVSPPLIASAYIQYTYITKFSVKLSYAMDLPPPYPPKKNLILWVFGGGSSGGDRKLGLYQVILRQAWLGPAHPCAGERKEPHGEGRLLAWVCFQAPLLTCCVIFGRVSLVSISVFLWSGEGSSNFKLSYIYIYVYVYYPPPPREQLEVRGDYWAETKVAVVYICNYTMRELAAKFRKGSDI